MVRRIASSFVLLLLLVLLSVGCTNKKVQNPIANVDSKQPDKVLFDRAMDAMKHSRYDVARLSLQTLINTYPDSEYIARAKLAVGDSWYAEGGSAAMAQAESEYRDFITFFPNMPEAAEAQLKIADIHYREMEKPDRDFTHALRAEEEYRALIQQWPDSKLVPQAKERLLEVQEVLAEREFRVARFYFMRESWSAAEARLRSLTDSYPLYSGADDALYMLGNAYEQQMEGVRAMKFQEAAKGEMLKKLADKAAEAYSRILTRYPVMGRAPDARKRLEAMHRPVPTATAEEIAQNKKEEASRQTPSMMAKFMSNLHKRPDTSKATKIGEPPLVDEKVTGAPEVNRETNTELLQSLAAASLAAKGGSPNSQGPPRSSDTPPVANAATAQPSVPGNGNAGPTGAQSAAEPAPAGIGELAPNVAPAKPAANNENSATPAASFPSAAAAAQPSAGAGSANANVEVIGNQPPAPPATVAPPTAPGQINEVQPPSSSANANGSDAQPDAANGSKQQAQEDDKNSSTSKKKKKKGLKKIVPF